ncbi:spermatogenesis-associated serine-rich protein 1 [Acanthopagrus latus]|uniref:spermatogenesis-associated serine-rich protein 1 n=1 Tax=Acanthopagrus latus TaxID=8177 RepID=UPI00187C1985|nr:spermatogenesis-associated serine-rich protein 1 [Acanthopagrus latus]XP_036941314.1 spermatogenesis-associated serine-rich protein 1 [Acanthopagrus latus]
MMNPSHSQPPSHTVQAEETCTVRDSPPQTTEVFKTVPPRHVVIGARPFCSPEYSPDFHKLGSTVPYSTYRPRTDIRADTSTPLQSSAKTHVPYSEKKRLLDKQEEIQEVKQLDEWRPAVGIFTAVLEELENKAS